GAGTRAILIEGCARARMRGSPFTMHVQDGTTFLFPIGDNAAKIEGIMKPAMDAVLNGTPASSLTAANEQVNALFK
ncbi:MAG TPA: sugar ABC transporter substrate-binding protein, partial [Arachnia sp.]|nr:sugar ABC transporter substrate-binding protein [Arachnia sp.]